MANPCADHIVEAAVERLRARSALGLGMYGVTLADSPADTLAFIRHAQEEAMDLANYLEVLAQRAGGRAVQSRGVVARSWADMRPLSAVMAEASAIDWG